MLHVYAEFRLPIAGALSLLLSLGSGGAGGAEVLDSGIAPKDVRNRSYLGYVVEALDTLMEHGTDRYGPKVNDKLLVSVMDVRTKRLPISGTRASSAATRASRIMRRSTEWVC